MQSYSIMSTAKIIVLCGTKASGKTSVGIELAHLLSASFYDTDAQIQSKYPHSKTTREIFTELGDAGFRSLESEVMNELLFKVDAESSRSLIALGGGACETENFASFVHRLKQINGTLIFINTNVEILLERIRKSWSLPATIDSANFEQSFRKQTERRTQIYRSLTDFTINGNLSPNAVANEIKTLLLEA